MKIRSVLNFVVMVLSTLTFLTVYDTVRWALYQDVWTVTLNIGKWGTPSDALETTLGVLAIILIARLSVEWVSEMRENPPAGASEEAEGEPYSSWVKGTFASLVFLVGWLVTGPFLSAIAKGGIDVFTLDYWWSSVAGIRREEVLAIIPATAFIIMMADVVRRDAVISVSSQLWERILQWSDRTLGSQHTQQQ
ncbi:MAG: hypothetical protein WCW47_00775 [Candidatus Paceibacterota bacterium]